MNSSQSKRKNKQRRGPSDDEQQRSRGGARRGRHDGQDRPRGGRDGQSRSQQPRRTGPALEYVLISDACSISAEITAHPGPLRWRMIPDVALLNPGLYLRYKGSLQLVTEDFSFSDAVLYTVWKDENLSYRFRDGWASPGLRAAFLVRTPFSDEEGPPWIPIDAVIPDTVDAWDTGLLSSQLDPINCAHFRALLSVDNYDLQVTAKDVDQENVETANDALQETITWLARHPESEHPGAVTARVMLVDQGHGLQRAGIIAMRQSDERTAGLLNDVLSVLAPDVSPVLQAVQKLWMSDDTDQQEHFEALARVLEPHVASGETALQKPENLAVLATWLTGIFGSRPDRDQRRPARSLFAAFRLIRRLRGDIDAFANPDVDLPTFPTSRALSDEITRELGFFPPRETDLERLIRAMAVGESTRDFGRVHLDHIRPFALSYRRLRNYPIASQTLLGRYDGIVTMWSFRGRELDRGGVPVHALNDNLVFETTSWASIRAYGRILGAKNALSDVFAEALSTAPERGAPHHPDVARIAELAALDTPAVIERLERATRARRPNTQRVSDAIGAYEYMVGLSTYQQSEETDQWMPAEPQWDDAEDHAVLRHFMYWRTYCRSYVAHAQDAYTTWIERVTPALASLPSKLENEAIALMRTWSRQASQETLDAQQAPLMERLDTILDASIPVTRDERVLNILSVFADISFEAYAAGIERLLQHPRWADAEWHRIIGAANKNVVRTPLLASDVFSKLGQWLGNADTVGAAKGRVEWLRQCVGRGRTGESVRWVLLRDAWPEVVYVTAFQQWFQEHHAQALDAPETCAASLLRFAATQMSAESIDIPMTHLSMLEPDKTTQHVQDLLDADCGLSCAAWLAGGRTSLDQDQANAALTAGLKQAQGAKDLRILARLIHATQSAGQSVESSAHDALQQRLQSHTVPEYEQQAFDALLDAWRLAQADLDSPTAAALVKRAAHDISREDRWRAVAARAFLYWAVDHALVRGISQDLFAAIGDQGSQPLFEAAWQDLVWPAAITAASQALAHAKPQSQGYRTLRGVLHDGGISAGLESALDAWILRRAKLDLIATQEDIATFLPYLVALQQNASTQEPQDEEADDDSQAPVNQDDADNTADAGAKTLTRAQRLAQSLRERVSQTALERIQGTLEFWQVILAKVSDTALQETSKELAPAIGYPCPLDLGLRDGVYPRVIDILRQSGVSPTDPRHVVGNSMIPYSQFTDPRALDLLVSQLLTLFGQTDGLHVTLTRDDVTISSPITTQLTEDAADDANPNDQDATIETDEDAGSNAAMDDDEDEDDAQDAESGDDVDETVDAPHTPTLSDAAQVWTLDFEALVALAPPNMLDVVCTRRVLARTPGLWLKVEKKGNREQVVIGWRPPRPKKKGRRSSKS